MTTRLDLYAVAGAWIATTTSGRVYALDPEAWAVQRLPATGRGPAARGDQQEDSEVIVELRPATVDELAAHPAPSGRGAAWRIRSARSERRRVVRVTALERDAARLKLRIDARAGRESPAIIRAVAAAKRA